MSEGATCGYSNAFGKIELSHRGLILMFQQAHFLGNKKELKRMSKIQKAVETLSEEIYKQTGDTSVIVIKDIK